MGRLYKTTHLKQLFAYKNDEVLPKSFKILGRIQGKDRKSSRNQITEVYEIYSMVLPVELCKEKRNV